MAKKKFAPKPSDTHENYAIENPSFIFAPKSCFKLLLFQEKELNKVKYKDKGVTKTHLLTLYNKTTSQLRKKCCLLLTSKKLYHETQRPPQIEKHRPAGVLHVILPPRLLPTLRLGEDLFRQRTLGLFTQLHRQFCDRLAWQPLCRWAFRQWCCNRWTRLAANYASWTSIRQY